MLNRIFRTKSGGIVYVAVRCPYHMLKMADCGGYVMEHRLAMANFIGRPLRGTEYVRHKDGDTLNNDIKNLVLKRFK